MFLYLVKKVIFISFSPGKLEGSEVDPARAKTTLSFEILVRSYGLCRDTISLVNTTAMSQSLLLNVCVFVDDPFVSVEDGSNHTCMSPTHAERFDG